MNLILGASGCRPILVLFRLQVREFTLTQNLLHALWILVFFSTAHTLHSPIQRPRQATRSIPDYSILSPGFLSLHLRTRTNEPLHRTMDSRGFLHFFIETNRHGCVSGPRRNWHCRWNRHAYRWISPESRFTDPSWLRNNGYNQTRTDSFTHDWKKCSCPLKMARTRVEWALPALVGCQ